MAKYVVYLTAEVSVRREIVTATNESNAVAEAIALFDAEQLGKLAANAQFVGIGAECIVSETFGDGGVRWHQAPTEAPLRLSSGHQAYDSPRLPPDRHTPVPFEGGVRGAAVGERVRHFPFNTGGAA